MKIKKRFPIATLAIVILTVIGFLWEKRALEMGLTSYVFDDYAFHWTEFLRHPILTLPTLVSYTFFHADSFHLKSNLLFFILFAGSVESVTGGFIFFFSYFVWGALAGLCQGVFEPFTNGLIGASGAISGAAGAFFVLFPLKMPFRFLETILGRWVKWIPAFSLIGLWYGSEILNGILTLKSESTLPGITNIAHWAHIGGFTAGALTMIPFIKESR